MFAFLGLVILLGLTLYISTLAYALRGYSRSLLAEQLPEHTQTRWLEWLERNGSQLQLLAGLMRLTFVVGVLVAGFAAYLGRTQPDFPLVALLPPAIGILVLTALVAVGIPYALATHAGEAVLARSLGVLKAARIVTWPLTAAMLGIEHVIRRIVDKEAASAETQAERVEQEVLNVVAEGELSGIFDTEQKEMIESVFELRQTSVSAIMTPRTDILAVEAAATLDEVRRAFIDSAHSRIPVYEDSLDHVIGVLYAKDLLRLQAGDPFSARQSMRRALYVPTSKTIDELLNEFRAAKVQIAIVLDEYGGTAGVATIEDILEELVGEIDDEYDQPAPPLIRRIDEDTLEVDARVHVSEINQELGVTLPEDGDYDTIGGFVSTTLGKIPVPGEEFTHENLSFFVLDAEERKINRLRIHVARAQQPV